MKISWTALFTTWLVAWLPTNTMGGSGAFDCPAKPGEGTSGGPGDPVLRGPGGYIAAKRGPSSRSLLNIDWKDATVPSEPKKGWPRAKRREPLPAAEALAIVAGEDRRPLLVLRECARCAGTEDALMTSEGDSERIYLLARWFHCVRLPPDVLEADHPFRNLFPGEQPAHVFIANHDGSARHDLQGTHAPDEPRAAMEAAVAANYKGSHGSALQRLARYLDVLDEADRKLDETQKRYDRLVSQGGDLREITKLDADLEQRRKERGAMVLSAARLATLEPRTPVPDPPAR